MPDQERPGDNRSAGAAHLKVVGGGHARRARFPRPLLPKGIGRRLAALERRVEDALGGREQVGRDFLASAVDGSLTALAQLGRLRFDDARQLARPTTLVAALAELRHARPPAWVTAVALEVAYRYWWRVDALGLERVPREGRVLLVTNRSGSLVPYEGLMIAHALGTASGTRPDACVLVDDWLLRFPLVGPALGESLGRRATPAIVRRLLAREQAVVALPEAPEATAKPFRARYRLASFGRSAVIRAAMQTGTPIVPVAVIGAEEAHPVLARLDKPGRLLGLPTLPVTPTFPWLGLAGLVPLPTKWTVHVGQPLDVGTRHGPEDATRPTAVRRLADQVRERLQALVLEGRRRRRSVFFA